MPLTLASPLASRVATVFEFLPALARRHLAARVGSRGTVHVLKAAAGVYTLVHQYRESRGADMVQARIAQLRSVVTDRNSYALFWKKGNGRWTAYQAKDGEQFVASIDECLDEIARDPSGCYWS